MSLYQGFLLHTFLFQKVDPRYVRAGAILVILRPWRNVKDGVLRLGITGYGGRAMRVVHPADYPVATMMVAVRIWRQGRQ